MAPFFRARRTATSACRERRFAKTGCLLPEMLRMGMAQHRLAVETDIKRHIPTVLAGARAHGQRRNFDRSSARGLDRRSGQ